MSAFSQNVASMHRDLKRGMDTGLLLGAVQVDSYIEQIKTAAPAPGFARVCLPGEPEFDARARREAEGIPVLPAAWKTPVAIAQELRVEARD